MLIIGDDSENYNLYKLILLKKLIECVFVCLCICIRVCIYTYIYGSNIYDKIYHANTNIAIVKAIIALELFGHPLMLPQ